MNHHHRIVHRIVTYRYIIKKKKKKKKREYSLRKLMMKLRRPPNPITMFRVSLKRRMRKQYKRKKVKTRSTARASKIIPIPPFQPKNTKIIVTLQEKNPLLKINKKKTEASYVRTHSETDRESERKIYKGGGSKGMSDRSETLNTSAAHGMCIIAHELESGGRDVLRSNGRRQSARQSDVRHAISSAHHLREFREFLAAKPAKKTDDRKGKKRREQREHQAR